MRKNLVALICFSLFIFACGKAVENEVSKEQIQNVDTEKVQLPEEQSPEALNEKAIKKIENGDFQGAINDLTKSLGMKENHYSRADLGRAKEATGDLEGALADYTKAIETQKRGIYYQWRSNVYTKMGKEAEAKKDMAEFEKLPKE